MSMTREDMVTLMAMDKEEALAFLNTDDYESKGFQIALGMAIKALEQQPCKDAEYKKSIDELKEQILKDGNVLLTKRDLLERFCEIDKEYGGEPWNLLQILANINIFIGEEPCEDAISRDLVRLKIAEVPKYIEGKKNTSVRQLKEFLVKECLETDEDVTVDTCKGFTMALEYIRDFVRTLQPVQQKPRTGHWINKSHTSGCGIKFVASECSCCGEKTFFDCDQLVYNYCPNCGAKMIEPQENEG